MGKFLRDSGLYLQAIKFVTKAMDLDPLDPNSYAVRGDIHRLIGNYDRAATDFQKALEIESNDLYLLNTFAWLLIMTKKHAEAEQV